MDLKGKLGTNTWRKEISSLENKMYCKERRGPHRTCIRLAKHGASTNLPRRVERSGTSSQNMDESHCEELPCRK